MRNYSSEKLFGALFVLAALFFSGTAAAQDTQVIVNTGNPEIFNAGGLAAPAAAMPMFNGALTEWFPALGASWQVPQNPRILGWLRASLSPATPVMLIFVLLNSSSPRAIA